VISRGEITLIRGEITLISRGKITTIPAISEIVLTGSEGSARFRA
jgi:hypothetical protein